MDIDDAKQEARAALDEYFLMRDLDPQERLTTLSVIPRVDQHFSIGVSQTGHRTYGMEVRVRHRNGTAARYAERLRRKFGDSVAIQTLQRAEIPSMIKILNANVITGSGLRQRCRPLALGSSVAHRDSMAGSVGLFVDFLGGIHRGRTGILSCSHVLARCGRGKPGDHIYQPGKPDSKHLVMSDRIAELVDATILAPAGSQELDVAVAVLTEDAENDNMIPAHLGCAQSGRRLSGVVEPGNLKPFAKVCKVGRTTDWTMGTVSAFGIDNLPIYTPQLSRNIRFDNVMEIRWDSPQSPFTLPGDSGSVVYDPDTMAAVGLVFCGGVLGDGNAAYGVSYACSLSAALQHFGVKLSG